MTRSAAASHLTAWMWARLTPPSCTRLWRCSLFALCCCQTCCRFYDPQRGSLTLDGIDIRSIDTTFLHQAVALVAQEPLVFSESIEYNICFGVHRQVTQVCEGQCRCYCLVWSWCLAPWYLLCSELLRVLCVAVQPRLQVMPNFWHARWWLRSRWCSQRASSTTSALACIAKSHRYVWFQV